MKLRLRPVGAVFIFSQRAEIQRGNTRQPERGWQMLRTRSCVGTLSSIADGLADHIQPPTVARTGLILKVEPIGAGVTVLEVPVVNRRRGHAILFLPATDRYRNRTALGELIGIAPKI